MTRAWLRRVNHVALRALERSRRPSKRQGMAATLGAWRRDVVWRWGFVLARTYLTEQGVLPLLRSGERSEYPPELHDLYHLHWQVRRRRPTVVLEFGVGFSTLVMAHALWQNHTEQRSTDSATPLPRLWTVDTSPTWIGNTRTKLPPSLEPFVEFHQSAARVSFHEGELCHFFDDLPDVVPDIIYLDGPDPDEVQGDVRGLRFGTPGSTSRAVVAADPLLFESTLRVGFLMVVDGRRTNVRFLRRRLKRHYRVSQNTVWNHTTFELHN